MAVKAENTRLLVTLPRELHEQLEAMAKQRGVSMSLLARASIESLLRGDIQFTDPKGYQIGGMKYETARDK
jgi:predicted DNA-binding protein